MRITLLRRGGLSVYQGDYDAKRNVAKADSGQQKTVTLVFPEEITGLDVTEDGIDAGTVTITDNQASFTISGAGSLECVATMGSERPRIVIEAETCRNDGYGTA